jgi:hypothetical protein
MEKVAPFVCFSSETGHCFVRGFGGCERPVFTRSLIGRSGWLDSAGNSVKLSLEDREMIDFSYLQRGIAGLARAHRGGGMAGHLGSGVIAGYFFGEERSDVPYGVHLGVERDLERIVGGEEPFWINSKKKPGITVSEMFAPLADLEEETAEIQAGRGVGSIAEGLARNIGQCRQSGHNVIFASVAIRALVEHPEFATPAVIDGMVRLMAAFDKAPPGRGYYGKEAGWKMGSAVKLDPNDGAPNYETLEEMVDATIDELIGRSSERRQGFGSFFHLIDHAAALVEIANHGFPKLAISGLPAHRQHLRLMRTLPRMEKELGKLVRAEQDPLTPEYWSVRDSVQWEGWLTHRIKALYGFSVLSKRIDDDAKRARADEAFRYLMA